MYAFVSGKIEHKSENSVIINNGGIGYEIFVSTSTLSGLPQVGNEARVFTYLHVREDAFSLFGFASMQEKQMFLDLLTVSGVGAKTALTILSGISANDLLSAITSGDVKLLSSVKGVGKKTAERIVLELKGTIADLPLELLGNAGVSSPATEAMEVLVGMGIMRTTAQNLVKAVAQPGDSAELIIQKCLKSM